MSEDMFEEKDYPTQWALNPSTYQNMSNDQVDWAALAQQWIKMKETVVPPAPPPPNINPICVENDGVGEAPMEMDTKEDEIPPAPPAPSISGSAEAWSQWSQWGQWHNSSSSSEGTWKWNTVPPPGVTIAPDGKPMEIPTMSTIPPAPSVPTTSEFGLSSPAGSSVYSYNTVPASQSYSQVSTYWSGELNNVVQPQQLPFLKNVRHTDRVAPPVRVTDTGRSREERGKTPDEDPTTGLDAAKRRQLPAWIREGLEKMEKEKLKAVERERQEILRKQELEARREAENEALAVLNPGKSKFDSDSEKETEQEDTNSTRREQSLEKTFERTADMLLKPRKSRFRDADSPEFYAHIDGSPSPVPPNPHRPQKRSHDEILQDMMLKVRRSLTEILLEVTNEEIGVVCRDVWNHARMKVPAGEITAVSLNNSAPVAQITRKLGLGIYGDSNSESEDEQHEHSHIQNDSDEELKETLKQRQQAFKKTEQEIEAQLAEEDEYQGHHFEGDYNKLQESYTGNTSSKTSAHEKEADTYERESDTLSSGEKTPRRENVPPSDPLKASTASGSGDYESESSSSDSTSSNSSNESPKTRQANKSNSREYRSRKSKSRSKSRGKYSRSHSSERTRTRKSRSGSVKSRRHYRSRSSSNYKSHRKCRSRSKTRNRNRSSSRSCHRSKSLSPERKWSHSYYRGKRKSRSHSRSRKKSRSQSTTRSKSRSRDKPRSRSRSRFKERSESYSQEYRQSKFYSSKCKRKTRSKSSERARSRSKSRQSNHRDRKKALHRYRN